MEPGSQHYLFLSDDLQKTLAEKEVDLRDLLAETGQPLEIRFGADPAAADAGTKEPATIIVASAAVIAALTPVLIELIRSITRRDPVIRERRLVPVSDGKGNIVSNAAGEPILHWVDVVKGELQERPVTPVRVEGLGIKIGFGHE